MYYAGIDAITKANVSESLKFKLLNIYLCEMKNIHLGQGWDIYWHGSIKKIENIPSEEDYLLMVSNKTGVLARMVCNLVLTYLGVKQETI